MKKTFLFLLSLLASAAIFAQEAAPAAADSEVAVASAPDRDWHLSVGLSYRKFDKPKFKVITNLGADLNDTMLVLHGQLVPNTESNRAAAAQAEGYRINRPGVGELTFANITGETGNATSKGTYSTAENLGGTIGGSLSLWTKGGLDLAFVANLSLFEMDSASRSLKGGSAPTAETFKQYVGWNGKGSFVPNNAVDAPRNPAAESADASGLVSIGKAKFDMQLWVLDAGLSLGYNFNCGLRLYVAGGPSLSIADMDSSSSGHHDNDRECRAGLYLAGGANFWFTERIGIAAEVRYDNVFGTVGTRYVKQDLDTLGGSVKLLVRF